MLILNPQKSKMPLRSKICHQICPLILVIALAGCANAPPQPGPIALNDTAAVKTYIDSLIALEMQKNKVPGLSMALVDDQRVVWAQGYGLADVATQRPATADTVYRAGSVSKLFTGAAILQLAEQGKLNLDQPVARYLPSWRPQSKNAQAVSVRQVMTHHAGLPRDQLQGMFDTQAAPFTQAVEILNKEPLAYPPGQTFFYSNLGFSLLGALVQETSGTPFDQYARQSLLAPMGMTASAFEPGLSSSPQMAQAYKAASASDEPALRDVPAGGLNTSVNDMARFIKMVFATGRSASHQVLKPETVAAMLQPQNTQVPLDLGFKIGLPWMLGTLGSNSIQGAGPVAHHAGATIRHRSQVYLLPQHKLGVVVMANSDTAMGVVDKVATETLKLALQAKTGISQTPTQRPAWDDKGLTAAGAQWMAGNYTTFAGPVHVKADGAKLAVELSGKTLALRKRVDGLFGLDYALLGLVSIDLGPLGDIGLSLRQIEGRQVLVGHAAGQDMLIGERLSPPRPLGAWRHRLGNYVISNPDALSAGYQVRLAEEQGHLTLEITHPTESSETGKRVLKPVSDQEALVLGTLAEGGERLRVIAVNGQDQLSVSGYHLRRK